MKKIFFSALFAIGFCLASNAQSNAATAAGHVDNKPKTAVEQSKNELNTASDSTKQSTAVGTATEKKCAKKSCCKKDAANSSTAGCSKDKHDGSCCKKKAEATEAPKKTN